MRIHLKLSPNKEIVPFNNQPILTGAIHKWIGENVLHDDVSLYSFSNLMNGEILKKGLNFENGSLWFISSYDNELIKKIISGIRTDPFINYGMEVKEVIIQENPDLSGIDHFKLASPVFIKRTIGNKEKHYVYDDPDSDKFLTDTLKTKMKKVGLIDNSIEIKFDRSYPRAQTKLIAYNNIKNKVNWCPIIIKGDPKTKVFAWNVGVGNSTGIGFGAIQ
jgi:CRISPR-associated endoribonuclease Cas6